MQAVVYDRYGSSDVLRLVELDKPVPEDDEVLVRVRAASINPYDWHFMAGVPYLMRLQFGLRKPKRGRPGVDLAGEVEAVGENVTEFRPGDEIFGWWDGAFAEYVAVSQDQLALKPRESTFEQAAAVPLAGLTALQLLRDTGQIQRGQKVLINGASGGVGTCAVQVAKSFGAEVTGVCSTRNVDMVRSIGADHVIDYTSEDFTRGDRRYDLILDNVGNRSLTACRRALDSKGIYIASFGRRHRRWLGPLPYLFRMRALSLFVSQKMVSRTAKPNKEELLRLKELLETGKLSPVIDRRYGLDEVPEAMRYLEEGHAQGKIVISV
ncbi:MAG: NAD(P)-dependent alcohol dehydrogenase [Acidobacteria bacterium]|nr:NAD(P)-dependent alcohol dehydrogenase [Acidobacteriota bacterium]